MKKNTNFETINKDKYKSKLNAKQYDAVTTINGPLLIIAGAGSGKTHTLINRVSYMIESGIHPENILLLTFTNAAANNMKERASKILDERCNSITACTYHSFCAKMLRIYGNVVELDRNFTILSPSDVIDAISFVKAKNIDYKKRGFPKNSTVANIFSESINKNISINEVLNNNKYYKYKSFYYDLNNLFKDYTAYKKAKNFCDYDDLLLLFNILLDNDKIRDVISEKYKYIMVDEYQDTNLLQEQIVFKLSKKYKNIAVVGDDYQSIYAFRGSDINNILNFNKKIDNCKKTIININYRSTKEILNLANAVMDRNANFGFKKDMKDNNCSGEKPSLIECYDSKDEAAFIIKKIKEFQNKGINYKNIAILERNSFSSSFLEILLTQLNIPFNKMGGLKFLEHECVLDIIAYLKCLYNPLDELGWFRILKLCPGIGDIYARNLASLSLIDTNFLTNNPYEKRKFYKELIDLNIEFNKLKLLDYETQINEIVNFYCDLRKRIIDIANVEDESNRTEMYEKLNSDKEILQILIDIALKYKSANEFLDALILDSTPDQEKKDNAVTISTIHSAKGLEWEYVFILDCVEGCIPNLDENDQRNSFKDNEELRCFYVAITRAKSDLYLMVPNVINKYGKIIPGNLTHYLDGCENLMLFGQTDTVKKYSKYAN